LYFKGNKIEYLMYLHGIKRSDGDDDSGAAKRRRAVGLQCLSKRFLYSGLNIFDDF
jgi:hypothetical protein